MTEISVSTVSYQAEKRPWLLSEHGTRPGENPGATLDAALFVPATHYPNGYIPSGIVLGKVTASGLFGPYDTAALDGRQTAAGLLFGSLRVSSATAKVGGALVLTGFVKTTRLPFQSGTGALGAGGAANMPLINFSADGT